MLYDFVPYYELFQFSAQLLTAVFSVDCVCLIQCGPACSGGSYREDPAGPTAGLAEPVPCDDMPAVSGAAGGRGLVKGRGAGGAR